MFHLPGEPEAITVSVQPARNFPVDVYYLMDQSFSMNDDLENLRGLASQLGQFILSGYKSICICAC